MLYNNILNQVEFISNKDSTKHFLRKTFDKKGACQILNDKTIDIQFKIKEHHWFGVSEELLLSTHSKTKQLNTDVQEVFAATSRETVGKSWGMIL